MIPFDEAYEIVMSRALLSEAPEWDVAFVMLPGLAAASEALFGGFSAVLFEASARPAVIEPPPSGSMNSTRPSSKPIPNSSKTVTRRSIPALIRTFPGASDLSPAG